MRSRRQRAAAGEMIRDVMAARTTAAAVVLEVEEVSRQERWCRDRAATKAAEGPREAVAMVVAAARAAAMVVEVVATMAARAVPATLVVALRVEVAAAKVTSTRGAS